MAFFTSTPELSHHIARGQMNRYIFSSLSPFASEFSLARRVRPSRSALGRSFSTPRLNLDFSRGIFSSRDESHLYLYRKPPLGKSRVDQATQLHTDGAHRLESAGTGAVIPMVARVTSTVDFGNTMDQFMYAPLPHPLDYIMGKTIIQVLT